MKGCLSADRVHGAIRDGVYDGGIPDLQWVVDYQVIIFRLWCCEGRNECVFLQWGNKITLRIALNWYAVVGYDIDYIILEVHIGEVVAFFITHDYRSSPIYRFNPLVHPLFGVIAFKLTVSWDLYPCSQGLIQWHGD